MTSSSDLSSPSRRAAPERGAPRGPGPAAAEQIPARSIARIFALEVVSKLVLGLSHVVTIRALSLGDFARFSYLYATAFVAVNVTGVALNRAMMVRSANGARRGQSLLAGALLSSATAPVLLLALSLFGDYRTPELAAAATFAVSYLLVDHLRSLHQSELRFRAYSFIELARAALVTGATVAAVLLARPAGGETQASTLLLALQGAAMLLVALPWVVWVRREKLSFDPRAVVAGVRGELTRETGALYGYFAAVGLLGQVEVFVLKRLGGAADLAVFSAAFRYFSLLLLATGAISAVLLPLSQRAESTRSYLRLLAGGRLYFLLFAAAALLSAPTLWALRGPLGLAKYPGFFLVYCVLVLAAIQSVFLSPHAGALMKARQYRFLNVLAYCVIAGSVAACVALVTRLGALGAALSYLGANLVMNSLAARRAHAVAREAEPEPA